MISFLWYLTIRLQIFVSVATQSGCCLEGVPILRWLNRETSWKHARELKLLPKHCHAASFSQRLRFSYYSLNKEHFICNLPSVIQCDDLTPVAIEYVAIRP